MKMFSDLAPWTRKILWGLICIAAAAGAFVKYLQLESYCRNGMNTVLCEGTSSIQAGGLQLIFTLLVPAGLLLFLFALLLWENRAK